RLDADTRAVREADLLDTHVLHKEVDQLLRAVGFGGPFDAGVDVFRILAENHHVHLLRRLYRAGHAVEVLYRPQAYIEVELLPQRDVEAANAAADRGGQRA